jgi:hypothetical protein
LKSHLLSSLVLVAFAVFMGCAADYGTIYTQDDSGNQIALTDLTDKWEDYDIYYATSSGSRPAAVLFDPRSDDKKLVAESWRKIDDPVTLAMSIRTLQIWYGYARVGIIKSPDNRVFGYMYYPPQLNITVRMIGENTLYVSTLPLQESGP